MQATSPAVIDTAVGSTERRDRWWLEPALVAFGFTAFIVYATWRALEGAYYQSDPYLSPFYSPNLSGLLPWWKWSPAILILWIPAGFRATCYYYRKAYYRSYFATPPACAVKGWGIGQPYEGESRLPLILQNLHRYFFYLATLVLAVLWYDTFVSFNFDGNLGVGLGSIILLANVVLLSGYSFGCHAFRHIVGGSLDCFSCPSGKPKAQYGIWRLVTRFNEHHMGWAWFSLFSVAFADFYVRLVSTGAVTDPRILTGLSLL